MLAKPLGALKHGFAMIEPEVRCVAAMFAGAARPLEFEEMSRIVIPDLGCLTGIERMQGRSLCRDGIVQNGLRVTTVAQRENDGWRPVLRYADRVAA